MIIPNARNAGQFNLSPTEYDRFNGFLFDGNSNLDVVLPKAEDGKIIFFYGYGGGGSGNQTYKFTGTDTHNLSSPPLSVSNYPFGVEWSTTRNPEQNNTLTLYQPRGTVRFRYTKIEFIAIGQKWYYVHPNYIHRNM